MFNTEVLLSKISNNKLDSLEISNQIVGAITNLSGPHDHAFAGHFGANNVYYLPENKLLILEHDGPKSVTWMQWDVATQKIDSTGKISLSLDSNYKTNFIRTVLLSGGRHIAIGDSNGRLFILNLSSMKVEAAQHCHRSGISSLVEHYGNIITTSNDKTVFLCSYDKDKACFSQMNWKRVSFGSFALESFAASAAYDRYRYLYTIDTHGKLKVSKLDYGNEHDLIIGSHYYSILKVHVSNDSTDKLICLKKDWPRENYILSIINTNSVFLSNPVSQDIVFADECPSEVQVLSNETLLVKTDKSLSIYDFKNGKKQGQININYGVHGSFIELPTKEYIFLNEVYGLASLSLHQMNKEDELDAILTALKTNESIKTFTLSKPYLNSKSLQLLYEVVNARPSLACKFSEPVAQQLAMKKTYEQLLQAKNEENQSLKLQHLEEEAVMKKKLEQLEKSMQESLTAVILKQSEESLQFKQQLDSLQSQLKESNDTLLELREELNSEKEERQKEKVEFTKQRVDDIRQMTQLIKSTGSKPLIALTETVATKPLALQIKEAKMMNETLLQQLQDNRQSIANLNLIRFAEDKNIIAIKEMLIARKAIVSIDELIKSLHAVNEYTNKEHISHLLLVIEQVVSDYSLLPDRQKNSLQQLMIQEWITQPDKLARFPNIKAQYLLNIKEIYKDEEQFNPEAALIPKQEKNKALKAIFETNWLTSSSKTELNSCVVEYFAGWSNKLKQCQDPMAIQVAKVLEEHNQLKQELDYLKKERMMTTQVINSNQSVSTNSQLRFFPSSQPIQSDANVNQIISNVSNLQ